MSLVIKEGGYYVDNNGDKQGPIYRNEHGPYNDTHPWRVKGRSFTTSGQYSKYGHYSPYDLIAEWTEPAAEWGEWGSWSDCETVIRSGGDYQSEKISGDTKYRVRKTPPAPVVTVGTGYVAIMPGVTTMGASTQVTVDLIDGVPDWSTLRVQP